jgi:hypothetical protein
VAGTTLAGLLLKAFFPPLKTFQGFWRQIMECDVIGWFRQDRQIDKDMIGISTGPLLLKLGQTYNQGFKTV